MGRSPTPAIGLALALAAGAVSLPACVDAEQQPALSQSEGAAPPPLAPGTSVDAGEPVFAAPAGDSWPTDVAADSGMRWQDAGPPPPPPPPEPLVMGAPCEDGAACASGWCVDGVCCEHGCDQLCHSCTSDDPGHCKKVHQAPDPDTCPEPDVCAKGGECLVPPGGPCEEDGDCVKGECDDGLCEKKGKDDDDDDDDDDD